MTDNVNNLNKQVTLNRKHKNNLNESHDQYSNKYKSNDRYNDKPNYNIDNANKNVSLEDESKATSSKN